MEPKTHDMTHHEWGHGISIFTPKTPDGMKATVLGHSRERVEAGDYLILGSKNGSTSRYIVKKIKYKDDPHDMFEATIKFYPRFTCPDCGTQYDPPMPESCTVCDKQASNV